MPDPATTPAHEGGETKPLPCPFCGQTPRIMDEEGYGAQVFCSCEAEPLVARAHGELALAMASWNTRAALAGTSADAGARETVTVWSLGTDAEVVKRVGIYATKNMCPVPFGGAKPFLVAITVTPGKERGR